MADQAEHRGRDIIVVGASSGGMTALSDLVRPLPEDLPAALFIVQHISPDAPGILADMLARESMLPARQAKEGMPVEQGGIYVAPPDHHLLVEQGHVRLTRGPRENRARPAVDPLFRTAASCYGPRVVGVVLSGALDDGAAGLLAVKQAGGTAIVQDPEEALYPSMPQSAMDYVDIDYSLSASEIGAVLNRLAREPIPEAAYEKINGKGDDMGDPK